MLACSCSKPAEKAEIKIPILEGDSSKSYKTAEAACRDLESYTNIAGTVEYAYAETLTIDHDTNILEYNVTKGDHLSKGDVIAVFSSADMNYEYQSQKILTDNAYSAYTASGTESARLEYEQQKLRLDLVQYKIDSYTIRAPYDCIISNISLFETGDAVAAGTPVCTVAKPGDVYVSVDRNLDKFSLGTPVKLKFGTDETYTGKVVMPYNSRYNSGVGAKVLIAFDEGEYARASGDIGNLVTAGWATVSVKVYDKHDALCIPKEAVMVYSGTTYCYIVNDGTRTRIPIETGETVNDLTIVLSGLTEGDIVSY